MEKDRRKKGSVPTSRFYSGRSGIILDMLRNSAQAPCRYQVVVPPRSLGPEICLEPAQPVGRLLLDTGKSVSVTLEIPAPLYLQMEMLSLRADLEAMRDPSRHDESGRIREVNLWEIEGRHCPDIDRLEIHDAMVLDRLHDLTGSGRTVARYSFIDLAGALPPQA